jgi:hypothetical protein
VCLVTSLVGSGGKADCVAGADRVIFCEAGMREEPFIVDGLLFCFVCFNHTVFTLLRV